MIPAEKARMAALERMAERMADADLWPSAWHGSENFRPMPEAERNVWRHRARAALSATTPEREE